MPLQPQPPQQLAPRSTRDDGFRIVSERVAYKRYVTVFDRLVEFPPATTAGSAAAAEAPPAARFAFDVVGHPRAQFHFVTVFPFHSAAANGGGEPTVTMIREYAQARPSLAVSTFRPCSRCRLGARRRARRVLLGARRPR